MRHDDPTTFLDKKRQYSERINTVEHGSFTTLVFSVCGGMGGEAAVAVKKLVTALATKTIVMC